MRPAFAGVGLAVVIAAACSQPPEQGGATHPPPERSDRVAGPPAPGPIPPSGRVANYDPRGVEQQPDYDAEAATLRDGIAWRMPKNITDDPRQACQTMLREVDAFYREVDAGGGSRKDATVTLRRTRSEDLESCARETSPAAATCVTVLLRDRDTEFPWLLDQCMRAFPKAG